MCTLYVNLQVMFQYAKLIQLEARKFLGKKVLPVSSHFLPKFLKNGYKGVERWYKEVCNFFKLFLIFIDVHYYTG